MSQRKPKDAHASCRYWGERAAAEWQAIRQEIDKADSHEEIVRMLRARCCAALAAGDPELMCAAVAAADANAEHANKIRFATAIAAMAAKKYECAFAAWDDGGGNCWARESEDPWVPDGAQAAHVLMAVCHEAAAIRRDVPDDRRLEGDHSGLCEMMRHLSA
jgi:hypothetical protein